MIHKQFEWPIIRGLTEEHVIALARCGTPSSFYDMLHAGRNARGKCPFCDRTHLSGTVPYENNYAFVLEPPSDFNRQAGALDKKFVIVLKRHTGDPSTLSDAETLGMQRCRRFLKKRKGCYQRSSGGISYMRHGSAIFNAGTVIGHLHENVDVPNGKAEVRPAVYKDLAGWEKDFKRLRKYLTCYQEGMSKEAYLESYSMNHDLQF